VAELAVDDAGADAGEGGADRLQTLKVLVAEWAVDDVDTGEVGSA
jgi:hypothetical protein